MDIDIRHIAKLSRLKISDDEFAKFENEMKGIVDMVNTLPQLGEDLAIDENNVMQLRQDIAETGKFTRDELFQNAPQVKAGCLVVPKTVE